jgi:pyochelin biosynthesis protein PchD
MLTKHPIEGVPYPSADNTARYQTGGWHTLTAGAALRSTAALVPNKTALVEGERRITYSEFDAASEALAASLLDLDLKPGDRALFQMGSTIETAIAVLACAKAGVVPVCTLPQHRAIEIGTLADRADARAYFVQADFSTFDLVQFASEMAAVHSIPHLIVARSHKQEAANILDFERLIRSNSREQARAKVSGVDLGIADVLMFQLSGGTTNIPKIIPRFHGEFLGTALAGGRRNAMDADLVTLYALPLIHTAGLIAILYPCILLGGTCVLMQRMDAEEFCALVERERVTHSVSIGPAANKLLEYGGIRKHDLSSLKLLTNFHGSEAMERHVGAPCVNIYGIGEGLIMGSEIESPKDIRFNTVGWPLHDLDEIRLVEPGTERDVAPGELGELCFRGPSRISGYFKMPEVNRVSFTSDGYFRTGDVMTAQSFAGRQCYNFRGRLKDNINRGGEKFGAEEVEIVVARHPSVLDAKIVAMPDRVYGEKACVFLMMRPGAQTLTVKELGDFLLKEGLAKFKLPERVETVDAYPVTRVGKVDKEALRAVIAGILAKEQGDAEGQT